MRPAVGAQRTGLSRPARTCCWLGLAVLVLAQIGYPLSHGTGRTRLVLASVALGFGLSTGHAWASRGGRTAAALVAVTGLGGLAVEALGVHTGVPFGQYGYTGALGPRLLGVPVVVPLAWTWMAWPAWLAAARLAPGTAPGARLARIGLAGLGLSTWDLFLDPQMVAEGYWHWRGTGPGLPGVPGIPLSNYAGWLVVALVMMALLAVAVPAGGPDPAADAPMLALYLWTYGSSVLAHAVFLGLGASAGWGALGMGLVALPLAAALGRRAALGRAGLGRPRRAGPGGPPGRTGRAVNR